MNTDDRNNRNRLPLWQSEKMRSLIEERWLETWQIVMARQESNKNICRQGNNS